VTPHVRPLAESLQHPRHLPEHRPIVRIGVQEAEQFVQLDDLRRGAEVGVFEDSQEIQPDVRAGRSVRAPDGGEIGQGSGCGHGL
jgi:hypothetical protein